MISCTVEHRPFEITKRSVSQRVTLSSSLLGEKQRFCSAEESKESSIELSWSPSSPPSIVLGVIVPQIDLGPDEAEVIPLSSSSSFTLTPFPSNCSVSVCIIVSVCLFCAKALFACLLGVAFWRGILSSKFPFWRLKCPTVCECVCVAFSFSRSLSL